MKYKVTDKSVHGNSQRVVYDTDTGVVKIISKSERKKVFEVSFKMADFKKHKPTFNDFWNMKDFVSRLIINKGKKEKIEDIIFDRIIDSQCNALRKVIKESEQNG
jgi:hypothetical protein